MPELLTVAQAAFLGGPFWQRINRTADVDHEGHPRALVGELGVDNRYTLHCQRCNAAVVEMIVERESPDIP